MSVAISAARIFSGSVEPARLIASASTRKPAGRGPTCRRARRRRSSSCRARRTGRGYCPACRRRRTTRLISPSVAAPIAFTKAGSLKPASSAIRDRGLPVQLLHRLGVEDRVRRVGHEDHHVRVLLLELQHLRLHVGRVGRIGDLLRDVQPVLGEDAGDHAGNRVAVLGVLVHQRDRIDLLAGRLLLLQKFE